MKSKIIYVETLFFKPKKNLKIHVVLQTKIRKIFSHLFSIKLNLFIQSTQLCNQQNSRQLKFMKI